MGALVGRRSELGLLATALDDARNGTARLVLVTGDAGIGKTRIVDELMATARAAGVRTAWGRAWEAGGAPELWPWVEVLRSLGLPKTLEELERSASAADDAGARFRLFDRLVGALRGAVDRPTVIALDDLHVADESTIRLTQLVARSLVDVPLLVVATHRPEGPDALADLAREATVIALRPLSRSEIGELVDAPPRLADRIADVSGGNPFFADELARLWVDGETDRVPAGVRDVVRRRADALPAATSSILTTCAVIGRAFALDTVAAVAGGDARAVLHRLAPAVDAGLLTIDDGAHGRFGHDLVRAALVDALAPQDRADAHRSVADVLERSPGTPAALLAHHCWEGLPVVERSRAELWATRAAVHARTSLAYEDAAKHWRRAASLANDPVARWTHLMHAGESARRGGDFVGATDTFRDAADVAFAVDDATRFAEAVLGMAGYADIVFKPDVVAYQERALAALPPGDSRLRALLLSAHATYIASGNQNDSATVASTEALAMVRRIGADDEALATVLFNHHFLSMMDAREHAARVPLAEELVAVSDRLDDVERRVTARGWLAHDLLEAGEVAGAERELACAAALSQAARLPFGIWATTYPMAYLALLHGELDRAEQLGAIAYEAGSLTGFADVEGVHAMFEFQLRRAQGRLVELLSAPVPEEAQNQQFGSYQSAVTWALAELGDVEAARHLLHQVAAAGAVAVQSQVVTLLLAEAAIVSGCAEVAPLLYDRLAPLTGMVVPSMVTAAPHGAVDRVLGALAALSGDTDAAARHRRAGRELNEQLGFKLWLERDASTPPVQATAVGRTSRVRQDGEYWSFEHDGRVSRLKDSPGVRYLARLLVAPGREHHALDLTGSSGVDDGAVGAVLDQKAKDAYRQRLMDLQDEIDDATAANDSARATRARVELDALVDQLSAAVGLGGRDRVGATATERARQSVTRAIKRAIERIVDVDSDLGAHLRATVRTGIYSAYTPDPAAPITWTQ